MIPVPGPVAPPNGMVPYSLTSESFISMVFTVVGCKTSYFHGICTSLDRESHISMVCMYSILDAKPHISNTTCTTYRTTSPLIHRGEWGTMTMGGRGSPNLDTHTHTHIYIYVCIIYIYILYLSIYRSIDLSIYLVGCSHFVHPIPGGWWNPPCISGVFFGKMANVSMGPVAKNGCLHTKNVFWNYVVPRNVLVLRPSVAPCLDCLDCLRISDMKWIGTYSMI